MAAGRPRRMTRPERRRHLLGVAESIVAERGAAGLTMERLAQRAGVTKPIVYDHFPNTNGVLGALLDDGFGPEAQRDVDVAMGDDGPLDDRIRSMARAALDAVSARPAVLAIVAAPLSDPDLESRRQRHRRDHLERWAQRWEDELGIDHVAARALVPMVLAAVEEAARQLVLDGTPRPLVERLLGDFVAGSVSAALSWAADPTDLTDPTDPTDRAVPAGPVAPDDD